MKGLRAAALLVSALATFAGCGGKRAALPPEPPVAPLHLAPLTDLTPAAGLTWLLDARPRELLREPEMAAAIDGLVSGERFHAFAEHHGGIDLREANELVVAAYPSSILWLVAQPLDPGRVEAGFGTRLTHVEGRSLDRTTRDPAANVVRTWGARGSDREQLVIFGRDAVGLEVGRFGPLRAAELFAEERLKRASPALRTSPLVHTPERVGDAPLRAFAAGPFQGAFAAGLGGLLGASTAAGLSARVIVDGTGASARPGLACTLVLEGGWGNDGPTAADRLLAAFGVVAASSIGRLLGLDRPIAPARSRAGADALTLEVTLDARALALGLRDATGGTVEDLMGESR